MAQEKIGYRRLYEARSCSIQNSREIKLQVDLGCCFCDFYLGQKPKFQIIRVGGPKYIESWNEIEPMRLEAVGSQDPNFKPKQFYTDIFCWKNYEVPNQTSEDFHRQTPGANSYLFELAEKDKAHFDGHLNLIAGAIGLRIHPQFVLDLLMEQPIAMQTSEKWDQVIPVKAVQILEPLEVSSRGVEIISQFVSTLSTLSQDSKDQAADALPWLLRAWSEHDPFSKFMALFIPLEIVLNGISGELPESTRLAVKTLREVLRSKLSEAENTILEECLEKILGDQRPSLPSRFRMLANKANLASKEEDCGAFNEFNRIRNRIIHKGELTIPLSVPISLEDVQSLEDLVERYVGWTIFGSDSVYPSRFRKPKR